MVSDKYFAKAPGEGLAEDLAFEALKFWVMGILKAMGQEELPEPISRGPVIFHLNPIS